MKEGLSLMHHEWSKDQYSLRLVCLQKLKLSVARGFRPLVLRPLFSALTRLFQFQCVMAFFCIYLP